MIDLFVMIGIGAITIYYTIKIYSGKYKLFKGERNMKNITKFLQ